MRLEDWHDPTRHAFACHIDAAADDDGAAGARGERHLWIGFNPGPEPCPFALPPAGGATPGAPPGPAAAPAWDLALDSSGVLPEGPLPPGATTLVVPAQALVVLRRGPDPSSPHPYPHPHPHLHPGPA
jgi:hypothetical protein